MRPFVAGLFLAGLCLGQSDATLSGRVTDAATHQPIEGALIATQGGRGAKTVSATSDANGAYSIRLHAGERNGLAISKAGYSTLDLRSSDRTDVRLNSGDSEARDFELSKPGSLSGHLVDRDSGKSLTGFYIHAIRWYAGLENNTGFRYPAAPTSGDGSFSIANLPPASYVLVVDPPMAGKITAPDKDSKKDEAGYGPTWYPGVPRPDMAAPIMLGYAEDRKIEMRLRKHELLHIAGTFQAPEGMESGSVAITVATEEKGRPTGAEGEIPRAGPFRIDGLEEGSYWILAATRSSDGKRRAFASRLIALSGHSVDDLRLEMRPGVTLRAAVKMADDEKDAKVDPPRRFSFLPVSKEGWGPMMDDAPPPGVDTGMIRTGLPPGKYDVALNQTPGYAVVSMALNGTPVPPGVSMDLESPESVLTFVLTTQLGSVTGVVRDSEQKAVADARVVLAPDSLVDTGADFFSLPPGSGEMITADGNGRFAFNWLAAGRYRVIALPGGLRMGVIAVEGALIRDRMRNAEAVTVIAGQSTSLEVVLGK